MRKIAADYVHTVAGPMLGQAVVVLDDQHIIREIAPESQYDSASVEYCPGHLMPGFINAHCHLELSFMKGQIPERTGLIEFVQQVVAIRDNFSTEEQEAAIIAAEEEMLQNGIVAVGDISNDTRSFFQKAKGRLRYHTFVEVFDLGPAMTASVKKTGVEVLKAVPNLPGHSASLAPHAPYSCTPELIRWVDQYNRTHGLGGLSIHNQEQGDENQLFFDKTGGWLSFIDHMQLDYSWFEPSGKSSLQTTLNYLHPANSWLFIHNTFTDTTDILAAQEKGGEVYWGFCPNANLYIEDKLAAYAQFLKAGALCVVGTDSLASNHQLSIWAELQTIRQHAPDIPFATLLQWGTLHGAKCLGFHDTLGSLEVGKQPGLIWVPAKETDPLLSDAAPRRLA